MPENDEIFDLDETEEVICERLLESLEHWEWEEYISGDIKDVQVRLIKRTEEEEKLEEEEFEDEELEEEERELRIRRTKHLIFEVSVIVEEEEF